jgi:hypothetical protein
MTDEILTLKEVAGYLKLAEKTAYRLALLAILKQGRFETYPEFLSSVVA